MKNFRDRICLLSLFLGISLMLAVLIGFGGCSSGPQLENWHTEKLDDEFTAEMVGDEVRSFRDYLQLEERLFQQLDSKVYSETPVGPEQALNRYSPGSSADPRNRKPEWNRTFELPGHGKGAILLLHGMSDSPYSLRAIGEALNQQGYHVVGLRLPGHGTAPSGLKYIDWRDMAAAARLAMNYLQSDLGFETDVHIVGYSTGASLALNFTLDMLETGTSYPPASLVLVSPAIRVHRSARFAGTKNSLSSIPGLGSLAWLSIMTEFDPYKYNSFATNAGTQVHRVTVNVDRRLKSLSGKPGEIESFPPVLVFKSTVDSTVTTEAVVDNLLMLLPVGKNELVLFDINRHSAIAANFLVSDPAPLTDRLLAETNLPFSVTFITNENAGSNSVSVKHKPAREAHVSTSVPLGYSWPRGMLSLSHVAVPIPADDPLYGQSAPPDNRFIYLGNPAVMSERGLLKISPEWLLRTRYNPFFPYLEGHLVDWLNCPQGTTAGCQRSLRSQ